MIIVLFGPPGAGKGTQAAMLAKHYNVPSLATGDSLRAAIANNTSLGQKVKAILAAGDLVSDDMVNELVFERLSQPDCAKGVVLDGYPRTVHQAEAFDEWLQGHHLKLDKVIELAVDETELVKRRAGRLYAPVSKRVYHKVFNPPKVPGICDETGEKLEERNDDKPEVIKHRLEVYEAQSAPVINYYENLGRHVHIDGMANIDKVFTDIINVLEKK